MYSTAPGEWSTGHLLGMSYSLQRSSSCILQPQLSGPQDSCWGCLTLYREAVGVFYSPRGVVHGTLVGDVLSSTEKQPMYSTAPGEWSTGHLLGMSYPLQRSSRCILQPQGSGPRDTCWGCLTLYREAVDVFYSPRGVVHGTLVGDVLPSTEKQSMYSTAPAEWTTGLLLGMSYPLQRSSRCILQPQLSWPQDTCSGCLTLYREAIGVLYSPS